MNNNNYYEGYITGRPKKIVTAEQIISLYDECGRIDKVAECLGLSRVTLWRRCKELNIEKQIKLLKY